VGSSARQVHAGALALPLYDVQQGRITIGGQDIKQVTQPACAGDRHRAASRGFNDTVEYNIAYGKPRCAHEAGG
jgi:ATP-binding cassette subfamily B protein